MATKLQTFVSKCLRPVVDKEGEGGQKGTIERDGREQKKKDMGNVRKEDNAEGCKDKEGHREMHRGKTYNIVRTRTRPR